MATATINTKPIIHTYKEINKGKCKTVKYYEFKGVKNGLSEFNDIINISKDRQFAKSNPDYWIKQKEGKKLSKNLTGLFKTKTALIFYGDILKQNSKHSLLFEFKNNAETLIIYYFKDFYTRKIDLLTNQLD